MADGVRVKFSADVSDFIAALDDVSDKTAQSSKFQQEHGSEIEKVAKAYGDLRASLDPSVASADNFQRAMDLANSALQTGLINEQQFAEETDKINAAFNGAADGAKKAGSAHEEFSLQTAGARREVIVLGHEIVSGNFSRIPGSLVVMAERAGGVSLGMLGMAGAVAAVGIVLGEVLLKQERWNEALAQSQARLANSGQGDLFTGQMLQQYANELEHARGVSVEAAEQIVVAFSGIQNVTPEIFENLSKSMEGFIFLSGEKAPEAAASLAQAMQNPAKAVDELAAKHVYLSATSVGLIGTLSRQGDIMGAQAALASAVADATQRAAEQMTPFEKASRDAGNALLDLETAMGGVEGHSDILATSMRSIANVLTAARTPVAFLAKSFWDLVDILLSVVYATQGAIDSFNFLAGPAAAAVAQGFRAIAAAARGDFAQAADIIKAVPQAMADEWRRASDLVQGDINNIKTAMEDIAKPWVPGQVQKASPPPPPPSGGAAGGGERGESAVERATKVNEILERTLTTRRDLAQIGADETRLQQRMNELIEESATATAERKAQIGDEVTQLAEALKIEDQRRAAIENRDKPKGGASQVDTWRTELAERKAGEDQFHQLSSADEAAFWQSKIKLTEAGSKEREAVEKEYYAAVARSRGEALADELDGLKKQAQDENSTVQQRLAALAQYSAVYKAQLAEGSAAFRAAKDFELSETQRIEDEKRKATEKGIDDQIKAIDRQSAQVQRALDTQVKIKGETDAQALQETLANLDRQYNAERDLLNKELGLSGLSLQDKQRINDQLEALDDKYNSAIIQAAQKTVDQQTKSWDAAVGPANRAIDQSVTGVITGQQTAQQAIARAAQSMITSYVGAGVQIATNWLKDELMMTTESEAQTRARALLQTLSTTTDAATINKAVAAYTAGETAKTSATAAGTATRDSLGQTENAGFFTRVATMLARWLGFETGKSAATDSGTIDRTAAMTLENTQTVAQDLSLIEMAAAVAAANAYAALAALPPAAAAAATAAWGTTMGFASGLGGGIASAFGGWGQVPYDGAMTELHKNEMVLPASIASPLRGMLAGGYQMPSLGSPQAPASAATAGGGGSGGAVQGGLHLHAPMTVTGGNPADVQSAALSALDQAARNGVPSKYRHLRRMLGL